MASIIGQRLKLSIFGESHGEAIGCVLDGLPAGYTVDMDGVLAQMARRAPGRDKTATPRKESDTPRILSGLLDGRTTGAPLCMVIENENQHSGDYQNIRACPRPGHADYTGSVRYNGHNDIRGGGHFSGRLTAPLVFAGAVCRQILKQQSSRILPAAAILQDIFLPCALFLFCPALWVLCVFLFHIWACLCSLWSLVCQRCNLCLL